MTSEAATLAGGFFWGMKDLIHKFPGVVSTRGTPSWSLIRHAVTPHPAVGGGRLDP
jgi:hypothetical protein